MMLVIAGACLGSRLPCMLAARRCKPGNDTLIRESKRKRHTIGPGSRALSVSALRRETRCPASALAHRARASLARRERKRTSSAFFSAALQLPAEPLRRVEVACCGTPHGYGGQQAQGRPRQGQRCAKYEAGKVRAGARRAHVPGRAHAGAVDSARPGIPGQGGAQPPSRHRGDGNDRPTAWRRGGRPERPGGAHVQGWAPDAPE